MKKTYILLLLFLIPSCLMAQKSRDEMAGVYYAYHVDEHLSSENARKLAEAGYTPFLISHYGRHGSRWMTSDERYAWIEQHFADRTNLTAKGRDVARRVRKAVKNARGNGGKLTPLGKYQHKGIARRMAGAYGMVFEGEDARVRVRSSIVGRCVDSRDAFLEELSAVYPHARYDVRVDTVDMAWIAYTTPELKKLEQNVVVPLSVKPDRIMCQLFVDPTRVSDSEKLMTELHTLSSDMQDIPLRIDFSDIFDDSEYEAIYDKNNRRMTITSGGSAENGGLAPLSAVSLWQDIECDADSVIMSGGHGATLRFGHDTNLYRLLTLIGALDSCHKDKNGIDLMDEIIPMAANMQMVFVRDARGRVLVALYHNEHHARLFGLGEYAGGVYLWDDVKRHVSERIHTLRHLRDASSINTFVGTDAANTKAAGRYGKGSEEHGQTLPGVLVPNGQNTWTPQTQDTELKCVAPYYYKDNLLQGFRNSHWIVGGCTQDYGSFTIAAITGSLRTQSAERATRFHHSGEISHPYHYKVRLPDERLDYEMTALSHSAILRAVPDDDGEVHIVITPNSDEGEGYIEIDTLRRMVYGYNPVHRIYQGWGERAGFSGHFLLTYHDAPIAFGTYDTDGTHTGTLSVRDRKQSGVWLTFRGRKGCAVTLYTASSFTSREGALLNLIAETDSMTKPFGTMMRENAAAWCRRFHTIDVEDSCASRVRQFYGAMYRASFLPRETSDVDGSRPRFADTYSTIVRPSVHTVSYGDFSMWDTYRALHPLLNIITPRLSGRMMQSLVDMAREGGWLPIFPCWNSYTAAMIGDHVSVSLADAWVKGVRHFDGKEAYRYMRKNAFLSPQSHADYANGKGRRALASYLKYGYVPLEDAVADAHHKEEQTSRTLEYAFDDFAVAQMAKALGYDDDYAALMRRSANWKSVINPKTHHADGRHADGRWAMCQEQTRRMPFITEGAPCHYTWYVPHDIEGLFERLGGHGQAVEMLDTLFSKGYYWHGNEPCHQIPWLYAAAGEAERADRWIRYIMETEYNDSPGGLSGNDDAGQMSAWYIFASMGFYPLCPATPWYVVSRPAFPYVRLNFDSGRHFTFRRSSAVTQPTLNGEPMPYPRLNHFDLLSGGEMLFP